MLVGPSYFRVKFDGFTTIGKGSIVVVLLVVGPTAVAVSESSVRVTFLHDDVGTALNDTI
jgi:hypothetical protein